MEITPEGNIDLRFSYNDDSHPKERNITLLTDHEELKAFRLIDYGNGKIRLLQSNKNIRGKFAILWSCIGVRSALGFFDSKLPFERNFDVSKDSYCRITLFIKYRCSVNGKEY